VIAAHAESLAEIPMAGTGTLVDLDTVEQIAGFSSSD